MDTKLTLKLNKEVIERAKAYASLHKGSLSRLIESYLRTLVITQEPRDSEIEISPFVKSLSTGKNIPADLDYKKEFGEHLDEKYK
jgi:hypothetical protein